MIRSLLLAHVIALVACLNGCATSDPIPPPQSAVAPLLSGLSAQISSLAAEASPAVVKITNQHQLLRPGGEYAGELAKRCAGLLQVLPAYWEYPLRVFSVPAYLVLGPFDGRTSYGTAFFVSPEFLLTNAHVVSNADTITATLADGRSALLDLEHLDPDLDLALLRVSTLDGEPPGHLALRSTRSLTGELILSLGYPRKERLSSRRELAPPPPTLTAGIVSATDLDLGGACRYLETDATLNPGNSGGPLLDLHGNVVGVSTMVATGETRASYAIPAEVARDYLSPFLDASKQDRR